MKVSQVIDKLLHAGQQSGFEIKEPSTLLSSAFPNTFTPSGGHELILKWFSEKRTDEVNFISLERCFRNVDLALAGTDDYLSLFEMLTFGSINSDNYLERIVAFLRESLLEILRFNRNDIIVTVFDGNHIKLPGIVPDSSHITLLIDAGFQEENILKVKGKRNFILNQESNSLAGPSIEVFCRQNSGRFSEVGSINICQFLFKDSKLQPANMRAAGCGLGIERLWMCANDKQSVHENDEITSVRHYLEQFLSAPNETALYRQHLNIIVDHVKAIVFLLADGQRVENTARGRILKKLFKKLLGELDYFNLKSDEVTHGVVKKVIEVYGPRYPFLVTMTGNIIDSLHSIIAKHKAQKGK